MPRFADCRQPCLSSIGAGMFSKHQFIPRRSKRLKYIKSHSALDFRTSVCFGISDVRLRPLGLTTARVSCHDVWISTGRVRPRSAPRGPGDIRGSILEVETFWKMFQIDSSRSNNPEIHSGKSSPCPDQATVSHPLSSTLHRRP